MNALLGDDTVVRRSPRHAPSRLVLTAFCSRTTKKNLKLCVTNFCPRDYYAFHLCFIFNFARAPPTFLQRSLMRWRRTAQASSRCRAVDLLRARFCLFIFLSGCLFLACVLSTLQAVLGHFKGSLVFESPYIPRVRGLLSKQFLTRCCRFLQEARRRRQRHCSGAQICTPSFRSNFLMFCLQVEAFKVVLSDLESEYRCVRLVVSRRTRVTLPCAACRS